jgi:hypothetical protein
MHIRKHGRRRTVSSLEWFARSTTGHMAYCLSLPLRITSYSTLNTNTAAAAPIDRPRLSGPEASTFPTTRNATSPASRRRSVRVLAT